MRSIFGWFKKWLSPKLDNEVKKQFTEVQLASIQQELQLLRPQRLVQSQPRIQRMTYAEWKEQNALINAYFSNGRRLVA